MFLFPRFGRHVKTLVTGAPAIVSTHQSTRRIHKELDSPAGSALRCAIAEAKQSWSVIGWVTEKKYYLELIRASEGTLSRWSRLHLQSLAPTNTHWARMVSYVPFSLYVIK
jgi:hypothetical protein